MTISKRIQDKSKKKRVHGLEVAEKWKVASKIIFLMEVLKQEPEMLIPDQKGVLWYGMTQKVKDLMETPTTIAATTIPPLLLLFVVTAPSSTSPASEL
ncbi:hypothetical protein RJT34_08003 [Clitoria ternatea]|uniref:Uncharacterized protein n=1 Tax=Clitoria ternatea TaxID=43366 RepID=A0AAN9PUA6_CLITE